MKGAGRVLPVLLALGAVCACSHFRFGGAQPRLARPLERGAFGLELGRSAAQIDAAAAKLGLRELSRVPPRRPPVETRRYRVERGTSALVSVMFVDDSAEGVVVAYSSAAPSFSALSAELRGRYGPPQLDDGQDLYWSDGWTAVRLSGRRIGRFDERSLEVVEIPRLGKIGFTRFGLDKAVVFGAKGFAVRDAELPSAAGCAAPAQRWTDPRVGEARAAVVAGQFLRALEFSEGVIEGARQDAEEAQAWQVRAAALYRLGRKDDARDCWRRAYELDSCLSEIPAFLRRPDY